MLSICYMLAILGTMAFTGLAAAPPLAIIPKVPVTYQGIHRNGVEAFLNVPYGQDTGDYWRFKPPRPHIPVPGSMVKADSYGPACPQPLGSWMVPLSLTNITAISEDCLNLNIVRPRATEANASLPVMVYIHGGSFWAGSNSEITTSPDGLVLESVKNKLPVIHVSMNYRLGVFGFAQTSALRETGSENAGLRDQRLAMEWVRENIAYFGGNPEKVTIFGQSSGGLSVGAHILSYGGTKPVPFQQAICQSQAMEPGITANYTLNATKAVVDFLGCNTTDLHSVETLSCLRDHEMQAVLDASIATHRPDVNIGHNWLPVVDGDYLPDYPSTLIHKKQFARDLVIMMGWCRDDVTLFTNTNISTANDTRDFIADYLPGLSDDHLQTLLELYSVKNFHANNNLSGEFYRAARIFRDIIMTCQPYYFANFLKFNRNQIYLYEWNQTILDPILEHLGHPAGLGPVHTSEFAYIFGNLSHYNVSGLPFNPSPADHELQVRASRSWSTFASVGRPGLPYYDTFQGWAPAFEREGQVKVFIAGGPNEGTSYIEGPQANPVFAGERLRQRCEYWDNSVVKELQW
ncbi:uncharacterized protein TrAtP1_004673 [Trichoderma atroviride]|nr:hypothetical protein TrAtP1_004673 [Trichoderma atroviride]